MGVDINALLIAGKDHKLSAYFEEEVLAGPEAFVIEIATPRDITLGFQRKLMREIRPQADLSTF